MKLPQLNKIKEDLEIIFPILYPNMTLEEVIEFKLRHYKFNKDNMEIYKKVFYDSVHESVIVPRVIITAIPHWNNMKIGKVLDGIPDFFRNEILIVFFNKIIDLKK